MYVLDRRKNGGRVGRLGTIFNLEFIETMTSENKISLARLQIRYNSETIKVKLDKIRKTLDHDLPKVSLTMTDLRWLIHTVDNYTKVLDCIEKHLCEGTQCLV